MLSLYRLKSHSFFWLQTAPIFMWLFNCCLHFFLEHERALRCSLHKLRCAVDTCQDTMRCLLFQIRIFSYAVGPIASPVAAVRWIGCSNRGQWCCTCNWCVFSSHWDDSSHLHQVLSCHSTKVSRVDISSVNTVRWRWQLTIFVFKCTLTVVLLTTFILVVKIIFVGYHLQNKFIKCI